MKLFSTLKKQATSFLEQYKQKNPATYAAAEQAIGSILIVDGFIGIENPFGGKKRPGIFGTIGGVVLGIVFMLVPVFMGNITNMNNMTATTSATIVSVGTTSPAYSSSNRSEAASCSLKVHYLVDGKEYTQQSSVSSSSYCSLAQGQAITINYDPQKPGSWIYGAKTFGLIFQIFFWIGILIIISSIITFFIRLLSIIFGWKLLRNGRKDAANLPQGANLETLINEIKQDFAKTVFKFGGTGEIVSTAENMIMNQPTNPN